jgi:5-(carboxyamino)imidazole ribonucleotide synthase
MLAPGSVIGIVGGGQLGRMVALAAARLGYRCHILTPEADSPAAQVTSLAMIAPYDDAAALERFAASVDVVTMEFENLPVAALATLARTRPVHPSPAVLAICQDRREEKAFLNRIGVPVAPYAIVKTWRARWPCWVGPRS